MKQIYIVTGSDYYKRPIMAYETRNDAVRVACAVHECDASDAADYIRAVPFMADMPKTVDLADVQTDDCFVHLSAFSKRVDDHWMEKRLSVNESIDVCPECLDSISRAAEAEIKKLGGE